MQAAHRAVKVPEYKMPAAAKAVGSDELLSEAFAILTECALPPRERGNLTCAQCGKDLENVRAGAKFCSKQCKHLNTMQRRRAGYREAVLAPPKGHVGSMHSWPEDERMSYAAREVGLQLCNYVRIRAGRLETAASPHLENADLAHDDADVESVRSVLEDYLVEHGIEFTDDDSTRDLIEAVQHLRGLTPLEDHQVYVPGVGIRGTGLAA